MLLIWPPLSLIYRYLLEFTSEALAGYSGLGIEVWSLPGQAWITVRLKTRCTGRFLPSQAHNSVSDENTKVHSWHQDKLVSIPKHLLEFRNVIPTLEI